jgi:class 3 adenylate cyclase
MSSEVMASLMESPDNIKLGGDKRNATVFFADIRGYTSFSESRDPEYIVDILNEYFSEAVEHIVRHKGYIDKYIGDCIMAVWGGPMMSEKEDAINAVLCALIILRRRLLKILVCMNQIKKIAKSTIIASKAIITQLGI